MTPPRFLPANWKSHSAKHHGSTSKSNEHKEIQLVDDDPSKTALIGANLDPK
jgi:hypothetical protein